MKLSEYIKNSNIESYKYVGDTWGYNSGHILTKDQILSTLDQCDFDDEMMKYHPAYGIVELNDTDESVSPHFIDGYYTEGKNIGYFTGLGYYGLILVAIDQ